MNTTSLVALLQGGDRRSVGRAAEVVAMVCKAPARFAELIGLMSHHDVIVRMRAADVAEKVSAVRPELLVPFKKVLLDHLDRATQQELRWHVAQMVPRLPLSDAQRTRSMELLMGYLGDKSNIVRASALSALADLAQGQPKLVARVEHIARGLLAGAPPSVMARSRKVLARLSRLRRH